MDSFFAGREEHRGRLVAECQQADAIVLTYACDRPSTLERLSSYWLPELRRLDVSTSLLFFGDLIPYSF